MQDARGVEAVGVGRDAAHGVHADRAADHLVVPAAVPVGPGDVEGDLLLEGGMRQLGGDAADGGCRHAGHRRDVLGRVVGSEKALGHQLEHRHRLAPVGERECAGQRGRQIGGQAAREACRTPCRRRAGCPSRRARTGRRRRRPDRGSPARARWCSARGSRHRSAAVASSSWIRAAANSPSVPGLMPIHSSAMAL